MRAPEWIPEVAKAANCVYANLQPGTMPANLTYRLGADKRLAGVWRTLAEARHDKDVTVLFWMVVACAVGCCDGRLTVVTRRELEETAAQFRKTAQQLRLLVGLVQREPQKRVLREAAKACEGFASTAVSDRIPSLVVNRKVQPKVRAYVVYLSAIVEGASGHPFNKVVGKIATVAFDLKKSIPIRTVEYWRRGS